MAVTGKRCEPLGLSAMQLLRQCLTGSWSPRFPRLPEASFRDYPDRDQVLQQAIGAIHGLPLDWVLPGNGAAELLTWAARDAAAAGLSGLLSLVCRYRRALNVGRCMGGDAWRCPGIMRAHCTTLRSRVLWRICNPHNPTGQLWSRASLEAMLDRHALVIDEAFLPLVPEAEHQSMIGLMAKHQSRHYPALPSCLG